MYCLWLEPVGKIKGIDHGQRKHAADENEIFIVSFAHKQIERHGRFARQTNYYLFRRSE
jgi:hypothetical protein